MRVRCPARLSAMSAPGLLALFLTAFQTHAKVLPLPDLNVADRQSERTDASGSAASRACESEPKFEEQVWP